MRAAFLVTPGVLPVFRGVQVRHVHQPGKDGVGSFWRRCGLLARLRVRFAAILFPPTCQSTAGGTFYPKNVTRRVLRARCDMPERLFDGDDDAAVGGEGEGTGVVEFADEVVGAGGVR